VRPGALQWLSMRISRWVYLRVLALRYSMAAAEVDNITTCLEQDQEDLRQALLTQQTIATEMRAVGLLPQNPNEGTPS